MVTETEVWSVRVSGWSASSVDRACSHRRRHCRARPRLRRRGLAHLRGRGGIEAVAEALLGTGASIRSRALVGSHATRYTVPKKTTIARAPCVATRREPKNATMTAMYPQPRPGVLDIQAYVPGKSSAPGVANVFKLSSNETPLGPSPQRDRRLQVGRQASGRLSRRLGKRTARSDRAGLRARSGAHRLRRRLRRFAQSLGARLSRRRRRGDPHDARLSGLSDRNARQRSPACGRAGEGLTADVDAILGGRDQEDQNRLSWPIRTIRPERTFRSTKSSGCTGTFRATCCWCSTQPTPSMSGATTTNPASNSSPPTRTW